MEEAEVEMVVEAVEITTRAHGHEKYHIKRKRMP
jgi:hypothetical protein